jgi:CysZ protein
MIFVSAFKGFLDMLRPGALGLVLISVAFSVALLGLFYAGLVHVIDMFTPDNLTLPWFGPVSIVHELVSWASLGFMLVLSFFLMVPVASAFIGFFLDVVAGRVERRHYPHLPAPRHQPLPEMLVDTLNFLVLLVVVNLLALFFLYPFAGPFAPIAFYAVNGYLLGREYMQLVALRWMDRPAAKEFRRLHSGTAWMAGALMAVPLSIPVVNLFVPVLGAATFTHLFHRLRGTADTWR